MCQRGSGESPTTTTVKPTKRRTTTATTTTTTAPTTTVGTTRKTTTKPSTSTLIPTIIETPFHSTTYLDVSPDTTTATTSLSSNLKETSARNGSMAELGLIGAVIGGLFLLMVVLLCSFFIYRQRRSKALKDGSRKPDTNDSNLNGESGLAAQMTSIPTYEVEQHDEERDAKPLYTQVNKKQAKQNASEIHLQNGNKALEFQTAMEKSRYTEKSKEPEENEMVDNELYEIDSDPQSVVHGSSTEVDISQTNGNHFEKAVVSGTLNKVQGRVTYENVETTADNTPYENQPDHLQGKPESDWGNAYDKLDRLDHVIADQKVMGENVYDM